MGRVLTHLTRLTVLVLVAGTVAACSSGPDPAASRDTLERQRADVLASTRAAVDAIVAALGGSARDPSGTFEGCVSSGTETYGSFRYAVRGRVDAAGLAASRPLLDQVAGALSGAGFADVERGTRPQGETVTVREGDVAITVSEFPELGDYVIVDAAGPCVETPDDDSDYWLRRPADTTLAG